MCLILESTNVDSINFHCSRPLAGYGLRQDWRMHGDDRVNVSVPSRGMGCDEKNSKCIC